MSHDSLTAENEANGTFRCDICGRDWPHHHSDTEVETERFARAAFEAAESHTSPDSDGQMRTVKPLSMGDGPAKQYWPTATQRRWVSYVDGWVDCMKSRKERGIV